MQAKDQHHRRRPRAFVGDRIAGAYLHASSPGRTAPVAGGNPWCKAKLVPGRPATRLGSCLVPEEAEGRLAAAKEKVVVAIAGFAPARLEPALRLTAQDHNEVRVLAGFHAGAFIGDDEGRAR